MMYDDEIVYFEAQTGLVRSTPPSFSNYYQYQMPR